MTRTRVTRQSASTSDYRTHHPAPPVHVSLAFALAVPATLYAVTQPLVTALFAVFVVAAAVTRRRR